MKQPDALRLAEWCDTFNTVTHDQTAAELRRLHAEVERLREDAVRYRKLRSPLFGRGIRVIMPTPYPAILSGAELDREIDAALKEGQR